MNHRKSENIFRDNNLLIPNQNFSNNKKTVNNQNKFC